MLKLFKKKYHEIDYKLYTYNVYLKNGDIFNATSSLYTLDSFCDVSVEIAKKGLFNNDNNILYCPNFIEQIELVNEAVKTLLIPEGIFIHTHISEEEIKYYKVKGEK